jgi:hypothetical protein
MTDVDRAARTDWAAIATWTFVPLTVAAGFVYIALTPQWESGDWAPGLVALVPLEYFRAFVLSILSETYREYRTPAQAARVFLISLAILISISTAISLYVLKGDWLAWITQPPVYRAIAFALAIVTVDGVIGVYFFRGDARRLAARLQAVADDAADWLQLAAIQMPVVLALSYGALLLLREARGIARWVPDPTSETVRALCLLYAAFYFVGKAALLAHANTAAFNRSGRRLLGAPWIQFLIWEKNKDARRSARDERTAAQRRQVILAGEAEESP